MRHARPGGRRRRRRRRRKRGPLSFCRAPRSRRAIPFWGGARVRPRSHLSENASSRASQPAWACAASSAASASALLRLRTRLRLFFFPLNYTAGKVERCPGRGEGLWSNRARREDLRSGGLWAERAGWRKRRVLSVAGGGSGSGSGSACVFPRSPSITARRMQILWDEPHSGQWRPPAGNAMSGRGEQPFCASMTRRTCARSLQRSRAR